MPSGLLDERAAREIVPEYFAANLCEPVAIADIGDEHGHLQRAVEIPGQSKQQLRGWRSPQPQIGKDSRQRPGVLDLLWSAS